MCILWQFHHCVPNLRLRSPLSSPVPKRWVLARKKVGFLQSGKRKINILIAIFQFFEDLMKTCMEIRLMAMNKDQHFPRILCWTICPRLEVVNPSWHHSFILRLKWFHFKSVSWSWKQIMKISKITGIQCEEPCLRRGKGRGIKMESLMTTVITL